MYVKRYFKDSHKHINSDKEKSRETRIIMLLLHLVGGSNLK